MSDDLLEELARVARERREAEARDARWEGLAEGALSEEERRELERLAQESPEARAAHEAFRPLDAAARQRIVARLEQEGAGAKVVPLASRRRLAKGVVPAALAALAAGVLLLVLPVGGGAPVPEYALSFSGEQGVRSDAPEAEVPRLGPGSRFTLVVRPEQAVDGKVEARAFLVREGEARAWSPPMEVSAEGAVRIQGRAEELPVPPGEWTVAIAVGRPGALPTEPREVQALIEARRVPDSDAWRLLTRKFLLTPPS